MKPKLVIFDMDGLMFETGRLAYSAYLQSAERYNYEMIHDVYYYLTGRTESSIIERMKELYGENNDVFAWRKEMVKNKAIVLEKQKRVYKKKGLLELLSYLKGHHIKYALASSTKRDIIEQYLIYEGMEDYFAYIVSGDEVKNGKPNPEIFLKACDKAHVKKEYAMVLEDSMVGIKAANSAGIISCLIEDDITDMPTYSGKVKVNTEKLSKRNKVSEATYQFESLLDIISFIEDI